MCEFGDNLLLGGGGAVHPRVLPHLLDAGSLRRVQLQHAGHEVLELVAEEGLTARLVLGVRPPKDVRAVGGDAPVEGVLGLGRGERWVLSKHDKQDDARCEQVYFFTLVRLSQVNLWSHIVQCSKLSFEESFSILAVNWSCESEVSDLKSKVLVKEHVLWFQISMSISLSIHIFKPIHELFEVVSAYRLAEFTRDGHIVEEFPSRCQFKHDVDHINALSTLLDFLSMFIVVNDVY